MANSDSANQIEVVSAIIRDEEGNLLIDFAKQIVTGKVSLGIIEMVESLTTPAVKGVISVDSSRGEFDKLQLVGNETIEFVMKTPATTKKETDYTIETPRFKIYDFDESTDFTDLSLTPEGQRPRSITLRFIGQQVSSIFETESPLPYGFVGKIAVEEKINVQSISDTSQVTESSDTVGFNEEETQETEPDTCPGLINELARLYFRGENFEIEGTDNTIFLSPKKVSYPNKKITRNMNLMQLLKYATNYAWRNNLEVVDEEEPTGIHSTTPQSEYGWSNYFLWQDLSGWHFRSAASLAIETTASSVKTFDFSQNLLSNTRIFKFDIISDFSISKAFSDGVLYGHYDRIEPNYNDLYARFLDDDKKYKVTKYEYNYASDYSPIIGDLKFLPNVVFDPLEGSGVTLENFIRNRRNPELELKDNLFGFYNDRAYRDSKKINRLIGPGFDVDSVGLYGVLDSNEYNPDLCDYNLYQDNVWQEMFDCVDVMGSVVSGSSGSSGDVEDDCSVLRKIKQIKSETFLSKYLYKRALDYKEKWNIYRYSVCCDGTTETSGDFFAIIKDHHKIADNIYRYSWAEVALIPKADIGFIVGFGVTFDDLWEGPTADSDLYAASVFGDTGSNALNFYDPDQKISYVTFLDPENQYSVISKPGYFSGSFHFNRYDGESGQTPSDEEMDGVTGSVSWDYVKHLFKGVSAEGLTLTFHNSQYSPFLIIEKTGAIRGVTSNYSGAYNLNEIMNRKLLNEEIYPTASFTGPNSTVYYQRSLIDNGTPGGIYLDNFDEPDFTEEYLIGPGINANDQKTEYPSSFDMMPIGGYKPLGTGTEVECTATPFGHIVRMSSVSYEDVLKVGIEPRGFPIDAQDKRFFYFSAENAHDGSCNGECEL